MQAITSYNDQDVLCGRGGGTLRHSGNKKYRSLIKSSKPAYLISSKNEKTAISRSIVAAVRQANGRFLERSKDMRFYYDIGDTKATEKTSQALREGQPKLRKRMMDDGVISNDFPCSTEHILSLLPTASNHSIKTTPVFVGNDSYSSVDKNDLTPNKINQQRSIMEQSLNTVFDDDKPMVDDRWFNPTSDCQLQQPKNRIVTPPTTPPQPIDKKSFRTQMLGTHLPCMEMDANDFDDSNSIMTFEMDEDEMTIDDDDETDAQSMFSTPSPPLANHFRALNELKDNVPIYDNGGDQRIFSSVPPTSTSSIMNHLRALTELKCQVPMYPSSGSFKDLRFSTSQQFNGNLSRGNLNASFSSIEFVPNQPLSTMQANF